MIARPAALLVPVGVLLVALVAALGYHSLQRRTRTGFPAPDFTLPDLGGRSHRLSDLRGRVVFLNVWATWCPPCREEMPAMERLYRRFRNRDFAMLAVSADEDGAAAVGPFVEALGLTFPVLLDPDGLVVRRYGITGFPETFIIDRQGQVVHHVVGPADWDSEAVDAFLLQLLGAAAPEGPAP